MIFIGQIKKLNNFTLKINGETIVYKYCDPIKIFEELYLHTININKKQIQYVVMKTNNA